jgi:hypothetical protein
MDVATIKLSNDVKVECHYTIDRADRSVGIMEDSVIIEKVYYNGTDVTKLVNELDVNYFSDWEQQIKER